MTEDEIDYNRQSRQANLAYYPNSHWGLCVTRNCPNEPSVIASYLYVTGRQGRVTRADKHLCDTCAEKFLKNAEKAKERAA